MHSPVMRAYFAEMGMRIWDSNEFYDRLLKMTNKSETSDLDLRAFVEGCMKLRAPGMDLGLYTSFNELRKSQKKLSRQVMDLKVILQDFNNSGDEIGVSINA